MTVFNPYPYKIDLHIHTLLPIQTVFNKNCISFNVIAIILIKVLLIGICVVFSIYSILALFNFIDTISFFVNYKANFAFLLLIVAIGVYIIYIF